jgi:hypothetical protein
VSAGNCAQQRRLSGPIRSDKRQSFACRDLECHAADGMKETVPRLQLFDGKQGHDALVPPT